MTEHRLPMIPFLILEILIVYKMDEQAHEEKRDLKQPHIAQHHVGELKAHTILFSRLKSQFRSVTTPEFSLTGKVSVPLKSPNIPMFAYKFKAFAGHSLITHRDRSTIQSFTQKTWRAPEGHLKDILKKEPEDIRRVWKGPSHSSTYQSKLLAGQPLQSLNPSSHYNP